MKSQQSELQRRISDLDVEFREALTQSHAFHEYGFSGGKKRSCDWILARLPEGRGVDVGGTYYIVSEAVKKGREIAFYDLYPPSADVDAPIVTDDMANFGAHFERESLDFITCRHTLEHCLNPLFQLWQFNRSLRDDGRLLVIVPMHAKRWVWFYTHFNCVPLDNWRMLFYRAGFEELQFDVGTWKAHDPDFIEYRFVLGIESRDLRLTNPARPVPRKQEPEEGRQ